MAYEQLALGRRPELWFRKVELADQSSGNGTLGGLGCVRAHTHTPSREKITKKKKHNN